MSEFLWRNKYSYKLFILLFFTAINSSCNNSKQERTVTPAFYYWKSVFRFGNSESKLLDTLHIKTVYVKYFDVDWDSERSLAIPKAILRVAEKPRKDFEIIPCIFITNECIAKLDTASIHALSKNISRLLNDVNNSLHPFSKAEIQIDCDWTATTKDRYFKLLITLEKDLTAFTLLKAAKLSSTIRLHQVKYLQRTGIPPVSGGMLMAYNMGNLKNPATLNSILETDELKKYISNLPSYPLKLDLALPVFHWLVLYRNNSYAGLIQEYPEDFFNNKSFKALPDNRYQLLLDTTIIGYEFKKNDIIREEKSEYTEIIKAIDLLKNRWNSQNSRLALYHLDSLTLSKYTLHEMENIFNRFD